MKRAWLGVALLAASWLLGLDYFQSANQAAWACAIMGAIILLAGRIQAKDSTPFLLIRWPQRWPLKLSAMTLALPAAWLLPMPYKAIPVLLAAGLFLQLVPIPSPQPLSPAAGERGRGEGGRWTRQLAQGSVAAALILLIQSLVLWIYAALTARSHELPRLLSEPLSLLPRLWGIESIVDGSSIVLRCGQEIQPH